MKIRPRSSASFNEIMDGLERHLPEYARRDKDKVPHPATWLNQRRWEGDA